MSCFSEQVSINIALCKYFNFLLLDVEYYYRIYVNMLGYSEFI